MTHARPAALAATITLIVAAASCQRGPSRVEPPSINPAKSEQRAIEMYDADNDGALNDQELEKAPGLKAAIETVDTDKDGKIGPEEIAQRIRTWQGTRIGIAAVMCRFTLNGQPLIGATVTFEPEPFLGDEIQAAVGTTDDLGSAYPSIPKEKRPAADTPFGMQLGFYRVKVSKTANGKETIPEMYNSETVLGQQIAPDDPAIKNRKVVFNLKGR